MAHDGLHGARGLDDWLESKIERARAGQLHQRPVEQAVHVRQRAAHQRAAVGQQREGKRHAARADGRLVRGVGIAVGVQPLHARSVGTRNAVGIHDQYFAIGLHLYGIAKVGIHAVCAGGSR